jgi:CheY-like chemotaxis protein
MSIQQSQSGPPPTALLCEDEELVRELVRDVLEMEGFSVVTFPTADAGWAYLQRHRNEILLLVSDIQMPGRLSGVDLARLASNHCPTLNIVLSSAYCANQDLPRLKQMSFLPKPWTLEQLIQVCHQVMTEHQCSDDQS